MSRLQEVAGELGVVVRSDGDRHQVEFSNGKIGLSDDAEIVRSAMMKFACLIRLEYVQVMADHLGARQISRDSGCKLRTAGGRAENARLVNLRYEIDQQLLGRQRPQRVLILTRFVAAFHLGMDPADVTL